MQPPNKGNVGKGREREKERRGGEALRRRFFSLLLFVERQRNIEAKVRSAEKGVALARVGTDESPRDRRMRGPV